MVTIFTIFAILALLSLAVASLEMTFQYYMQPNMILYPYSVLLSWISAKGEVWRHLMRPLGRCRYCNGVWIFIYSYTYLTRYELIPKLQFIPTIIVVLLGIGLLSVLITILGKYVFPDVDAAGKTDEERKVSYMIELRDEETLLPKMVMKNTPWQAMLKSYVLLGIFYSTVYVVIPYFIN